MSELELSKFTIFICRELFICVREFLSGNIQYLNGNLRVIVQIHKAFGSYAHSKYGHGVSVWCVEVNPKPDTSDMILKTSAAKPLKVL